MFSPMGLRMSTTPTPSAPGHDLVHVEDGRRIEHRAAVGDGDHRDRVLPPRRGQGRSVDRVDGDVARRAAPVADVLAVEEHGRLVFLALADDDDAVEVDGPEELAHRVDRSSVGAVLVALADEGHGADGRGLGRPHEFHGEVAVGVEEQGSGFGGHAIERPDRARVGKLSRRSVEESAPLSLREALARLVSRHHIEGDPMPVATPDQYAEMLDKAKTGGSPTPRSTCRRPRPSTPCCRASARPAPTASSRSPPVAPTTSPARASRPAHPVPSLSPRSRPRSPRTTRSRSPCTPTTARRTPSTVLCCPLIEASEAEVKAGRNPIFQSHMWDGSAVPLAENLEIAKRSCRA